MNERSETLRLLADISRKLDVLIAAVMPHVPEINGGTDIIQVWPVGAPEPIQFRAADGLTDGYAYDGITDQFREVSRTPSDSQAQSDRQGASIAQ